MPEECPPLQFSANQHASCLRAGTAPLPGVSSDAGTDRSSRM